MYEYSAICLRVVDGDTIVLNVDLGMSIWTKQVIRLLGINSPEMVGEKAGDGRVAKEALAGKILGKQILLKTEKSKEKYGRYLGTIWLDDPADTEARSFLNSVNRWMINQGLAVPYSGGPRT